MRNITSLSLALVFAGFVGCSGPNEGDSGAQTDSSYDEDQAQTEEPSTPAGAAAGEGESKPGGYKNDNPNPTQAGAGAAESADSEEAGVRAEVPAEGIVPNEDPVAAEGDWAAGDTIPSGMPGVPDIQILAVHANGSGDPCGLGKTAKLKYKAMLANGRVIDPGTLPFSFGVGSGKAIKGWDVVVSKMRVGDSFTILLPMKLAYGPSKGDLKFDMELLSVK